jgi:hypothetical protein
MNFRTMEYLNIHSKPDVKTEPELLSECVVDTPGTELVAYYENKRKLLCVGRCVGRDVSVAGVGVGT